jgi:hypothetical protein
VPDRIVLQKLLSAPAAAAIVESGYDQVGGIVASAAEVAALRTPADLLGAYGVDAAPEFVDVVRFVQPTLAVFSPPSSAVRPWPTFPNGFLLGDSMARVWGLARTRYSHGAEYWRIRSDGEQKRLSRYEGAARGWVGAQSWRPPSPLVGPMARWRGEEYYADVLDETVLLTRIADEAPAGFELVHAGTWSATVPLLECEVFNTVFTAALDSVPVRLLRRNGPEVDVLILSDDPAVAERLGAIVVEPGVYEVTVDASRLANVQGVENQLAISADSRPAPLSQTANSAAESGMDPAAISAAIVEAIGDTAMPHVDRDKLLASYGQEQGTMLADEILALVQEASAIPIEWGDKTLVQGLNEVMSQFRQTHPGLTRDALREIGRCVGWSWR